MNDLSDQLDAYLATVTPPPRDADTTSGRLKDCERQMAWWAEANNAAWVEFRRAERRHDCEAMLAAIEAARAASRKYIEAYGRWCDWLEML